MSKKSWMTVFLVGGFIFFCIIYFPKLNQGNKLQRSFYNNNNKAEITFEDLSLAEHQLGHKNWTIKAKLSELYPDRIELSDLIFSMFPKNKPKIWLNAHSGIFMTKTRVINFQQTKTQLYTKPNSLIILADYAQASSEMISYSHNVSIEKSDWRLNSDWLEYVPNQKEIHLGSSISGKKGKISLQGKMLRYNLVNNSIKINKGIMFIPAKATLNADILMIKNQIFSGQGKIFMIGNQGLTIHANSFSYFQNGNLILKGNVQVNYLTKTGATPYNYDGHCEEALYDLKHNLLYLKKKVKLHANENLLSSDLIMLNLLTKKVKVFTKPKPILDSSSSNISISENRSTIRFSPSILQMPKE